MIFRTDGTMVAVVQDMVHLRVVPGRDFGTEMEVLEGLSGNEQIVTNPGERLAEGVEVQVVEKTASSNPAVMFLDSIPLLRSHGRKSVVARTCVRGCAYRGVLSFTDPSHLPHRCVVSTKPKLLDIATSTLRSPTCGGRSRDRTRIRLSG